MVVRKKEWLVPIAMGIAGALIWFLNWKLINTPYLTFSDSAKFADIARNLVLGRGFGASFTPFQKEFLGTSGLLPIGIPPFFPLLIAVGFKIFGAKDLVVILTSGFSYLVSVIFLYFLGRKLFGNLVGVLASLAFIFDPAMLNYATSGASEPLFVFELILAILMFSLNKRWSLVVGFLSLTALYWTRPSAIIYIFGLLLFLIFLRLRESKQIVKAMVSLVLVYFLIEMFLAKFSKGLFLYSPLSIFIYGTTKFSPLVATTATLRGGMALVAFQGKLFLSKIFYNLYNFYKLLPQIFSPYLFGFYILSLFRWEKEREKRVFRGMVLFLVLATFIAAAATLPNFRYLHPIIPFVYLLAIETLVWILGKMFKKQSLVWLTAILLVLVFIGGQTTGKIFLDSRYLRAHTNPDKPPVYVELSWILKENTEPDDLIITNLDTWGSWYGERKTIWFPLEPSQLIPEEGKKLKIDAIYLTSYKMDDENYFMGENWREIFYQPEGLKDPFFSENFELKGKFEIAPEETYEREGATAVLLIRK